MNELYCLAVVGQTLFSECVGRVSNLKKLAVMFDVNNGYVGLLHDYYINLEGLDDDGYDVMFHFRYKMVIILCFLLG